MIEDNIKYLVSDVNFLLREIEKEKSPMKSIYLLAAIIERLSELEKRDFEQVLKEAPYFKPIIDQLSLYNAQVEYNCFEKLINRNAGEQDEIEA